MKIAIVLLALLSISACTGMLLGGAPGGERAPAGGRSGTTQTTVDSKISGALRQRYSADREINEFGIGIRSVGGRVTLTGTVGSYDIRDRVVDIARNTAGVVSVDSRVVVNTNL